MEILTRMGESMHHRGPDGSAIWQDESIGLGHCMLHSTAESLDEKLPYASNESRLVISADARIDNRKELASQLGIINQLKDDIPDSQLILSAYRKWDKQCVNYLLGDFAFIIWDQKRQQLFCARDHLGIKSFYYYLSDRLFVFASEVRAILKVPHVPHRINEGRIADFLVIQLEGIDKTSTFYEEISRLPPAHTMVITDERVSITNYWELDPEYEMRFKSDKECIEAFREIFTESVRVRLRSNCQPASMLSGGIDSSSIVGIGHSIINETDNDHLSVYSGVSNNEEQCRESYFIRSVIDQLDIEVFTVCPDELLKYENKLQFAFDMLEEPFETNMTMIILIYLIAQKHGNHVVLDGVEGDIVHSLSNSYPAFLLRSGHWLKALSEINGLWQNTYQKRLTFTKVLIAALRTACVTNLMRRWRRQFFSETMTRTVLKDSIINRIFAEKVDIKARLEQLRTHGGIGLCSTLREQHIRNILHPNLTVALERYDRVAAVCSVEPRHPLLDKRLVEFSVSLPWDQKVRDGWSKYLLRRACEPLLPSEVVWRKGWEHIGWSFTNAWIQEKYDKILEEILVRETLLKQYVDNQFLGRILQKDYNVKTSEDKAGSWDIFQLIKWLDRQ